MSSDVPPKSTAYPGGWEAILAQYEARRDPVEFGPGEALPPLDIDFTPLRDVRIAPPEAETGEGGRSKTSYAWKRRALRSELAGLSELCFLNAMLITCLRKRAWPDHAPALFERLWAEESTHLMAQLDLRWLVSSVTTFGDTGRTAAQRSVGLALNTLCAAVKLYESERQFGGLTADTPHTLGNRAKGPLPLDMDAYALMHGGVDVNTLARLWEEAGADPVIAPLARHILTALIEDPRSVLHRLHALRAEKARRQSRQKAKRAAAVPVKGEARWGVVATVKAPLDEIQRFAAWHLDQGAAHLHLYLDEAAPGTAQGLASHPRISVTQTDDLYWQKRGGRPQMHQVRQCKNAVHANNRAKALDWLCHIDVDEFLQPQGAETVSQMLAGLPDQALCARVRPVEALAPVDMGSGPEGSGATDSAKDTPATHFKAFHLPREARQRAAEKLFPTWGRYLPGGFISHVSGKMFFRAGHKTCKVKIHNVYFNGIENPGEAPLPGLDLLHLHADDWDRWLAHYRYRLERGSYRAELKAQVRGKGEAVNSHTLFRQIEEDGGESALRAFFDEVCTARPALLAALSEEALLRRYDLPFERLVARHFPAQNRPNTRE